MASLPSILGPRRADRPPSQELDLTGPAPVVDPKLRIARRVADADRARRASSVPPPPPVRR